MEEILKIPAPEAVAKIKSGMATFGEIVDIMLFFIQSVGSCMIFVGWVYTSKYLLVGLSLFLFGILNRILKRVYALPPKPE